MEPSLPTIRAELSSSVRVDMRNCAIAPSSYCNVTAVVSSTPAMNSKDPIIPVKRLLHPPTIEVPETSGEKRFNEKLTRRNQTIKPTNNHPINQSSLQTFRKSINQSYNRLYISTSGLGCHQSIITRSINLPQRVIKRIKLLTSEHCDSVFSRCL